MSDKVLNLGFVNPNLKTQTNSSSKFQSISSAVESVSQNDSSFGTVRPGTAHLQSVNYSNQALDNTNTWTNAAKETAKFSVNKMYFGEDYSKIPGSLGPYNFPTDSGKSRLSNAWALGAAPFATDSNTIAGNYGFSTAVASGGSSTAAEEVDILGLDEDKDDDDDTLELADDLQRQFDRIDAHELKHNPEARLSIKELERKELIKDIDQNQELPQEHKEELKDTVAKIDEFPKSDQNAIEKDIKEEVQDSTKETLRKDLKSQEEQPPSPPPPPRVDDEEDESKVRN
jgi:hypothetical protein